MTDHFQSSASGGLQLHITRFEGQALQLRWAWPSKLNKVDLATVLDTLGLAPQAVEEAHHVSFHLAPHQSAASLAVSHNCSQLRCSINGQKLATNHLVWLQQGDVLDVGLCRLALEATQDPAPAPAPKIDDVDLTRLASGVQARSSVDRLLDAPDAFDDLLHATPWRTAPAATDELAPQVQVHAPTQLPGAHAAKRREPLAQTPVTDIADGLKPKTLDDPLGQWHTQFLRRLQSPNEALSQGEWVGLSEQQQNSHADALEDLMQQSQTGPDLSALLGQDTHINTVLVQLDAHGVNDLFEPPESVNVLHLFAPEGWSAADQSAQVPLLSRQEHHGMALDSAVPLNAPYPPISGKQDT
jgi:hypothetical protein